MKIQKIILCISSLLNIAFLAFVWFKFSQLVPKLPPDKGVQTIIWIITWLDMLIILMVSVTGLVLWVNRKFLTAIVLVIFLLLNAFSFSVFFGAIPGPKLCGTETVVHFAHPVLMPGTVGFQFASLPPDTVITCTQSIFSEMSWRNGKTQLEWGKYKF